MTGEAIASTGDWLRCRVRAVADWWRRSRARLAFGAVLIVLVIGEYAASYVVPIGWWTYWLAVPPGVFLILMCAARLNDLRVPEQFDKAAYRWVLLRSLGMLSLAMWILSRLACPFREEKLALADWPTWWTVCAFWGLSFIWSTTKHQPPVIQFLTEDYVPPKPHPMRRQTDDFDCNP